MNLKLKKISIMPFTLIVTVIHVVAGFLLGFMVTVVSLLAPNEGMPGFGGLSIIIFPVLNALLGCMTSLFVGTLYNFFAGMFGGLVFEFENA